MQQALTLLVRGVVGLLRLFALDKRSLALFRICMGILTVYDLQQRFPDIHNHYSDRGIISRSLALDKFHNYYWLSVHMLAGNDFYTQLVFLMHGAIAIGMIIGYHSRLMTFLNWIMVCSLQNRNYVVCHSGDTVQRVMLFWAIFLPLGEVFSLDSLLGKKKAKKERGNINYEVLGFGAMAFTIQIYIMYVTAHFHKSAPEWRELGTATWMALQLDFFRSWVGDIFSLSPWLCKQLTFAVLYWQVTGVVLYFLPVGKYNKYLKAFSVFGYFCMHLGFGMCLMLEQFTWVTEASLMGVVPGWVWEELIKYFEGKQKKALQIHYLKRCRFCSLTAEILGLFMLPKTKIIATDSLPGRKEYGFMGIVVVDSNRVEHNGPAVFEVITKESPILYPLHYVLRNKFVQNVISVMSHQLHYHKITHESDDTKYDPESGVSIDIGVDNYGAAQTQAHTGEEGTNGASQLDVYKTRTPKKNKTFKNESLNMYALRKTAPIVGKVIVEGWLAFLLFLVLTWNAGNIHYYQFATPNALRPIMWVTQLDQYWGMFAPRPPDVLWWYNIEGELDDGTTVELFNDGVLFNWKPNIPHTFDKPKSVHASMGNHRWFKLFENGLNSHEAREDLRLNFGRWICREYNGRYFDKERLYKFSIHWMNERVDTALQDGTRYPGPKQTIWNHVCYDK